MNAPDIAAIREAQVGLNRSPEGTAAMQDPGSSPDL